MSPSSGTATPTPTLAESDRLRAAAEALPVRFSQRELETILSLSPLGPPPDDPTNRALKIPGAAELGRSLFYDPLLSAGRDRSCATCHDPDQAWTDGQHTALGDSSLRNTPTLWNVAHNRWFFWDGHADSLWAQAVGPLEDSREMGLSRVELLQRFASDPQRARAYEAVLGPLPASERLARLPAAARPASGEEPEQEALAQAWNSMSAADRELANRFLSNVVKALAAFETQIVSAPAPFDRLVGALRAGGGQALGALDEAALRGLQLFVGRAKCTRCHFGPTLSNGEFHNLGLPLLAGRSPERGRSQGISRVRQDPFNGQGALADRPAAEERKLRFLADPGRETLAAFKTPSLREVARTAPYMHDGRFETLEAVLDFYSRLPGRAPLGHREESLEALHLSAREIQELVAFLESLSGGTPGPELRAPARPYSAE